MNENLKKEILKQLQISKDALKSQFEIVCETYTEVNSKLDFIYNLLQM